MLSPYKKNVAISLSIIANTNTDFPNYASVSTCIIFSLYANCSLQIAYCIIIIVLNKPKHVRICQIFAVTYANLKFASFSRVQAAGLKIASASTRSLCSDVIFSAQRLRVM